MALDTASAGIRLHFIDGGAGDPPLVFVPGWCCDHTFFQPQFDHFKRSNRVFAVDPRGFGQSDRPHGGYDIPTQADDVARVCRDIGLVKPVIIGHSLGGMIAVDLAARYPTLVRAVVAVDPGPLHMLPETRAMFEAFIAALEGPDSKTVREQYIEDMFAAQDDPKRCQWIKETMCSVPIDVALAQLRGVLDWNGVGALSLSTSPLLVLRRGTGGSNEPSRLHAQRDGIKFGVIVGAGHFFQLEVPDQVNPMIERFLKGLA